MSRFYRGLIGVLNRRTLLLLVVVGITALFIPTFSRLVEADSPSTEQGNATFTQFTLPTSISGGTDYTITSGPDGNLWFTDEDSGSSSIGRITPSGATNVFPLPNDSNPISITSGPDGNLWFTEVYTNIIGRITPTGSITEFHIPSTGSCTYPTCPYPYSITSGPDGNLWFTEINIGGTSSIGRITPSGAITLFPLATNSPNVIIGYPISIAGGPDDSLWFTTAETISGGGEIGRMTTSGKVTYFSFPSGYSHSPGMITAGPNGNLWFTDDSAQTSTQNSYIGQITPTGIITEYALSNAPSSGAFSNSISEPSYITAGPDGNIWFTNEYRQEGGSDYLSSIGRITPTGTITEYTTEYFPPTGSGGIPRDVLPGGITAGPDGNIWFTETGLGLIGRINLNSISSPPPLTINYVALGDSYSSGEGNPPFLAGTDGPTDYCHRSSAAYPEVLSTALGLTPKFYACSGATTQNIISTPKDGEAAQLKDPGVDSTANLVTLTIGGDDANFASVISSCIEQKLRADAEDSLGTITGGPVSTVANWLGLGTSSSCASSQSFVNSVNTGIDNVLGYADTAYKDILGKVSSTNTSVIAADYPLLFPTTTSAQECPQLFPFLTTADQNYFNTAGNHLDDVLQKAAGQAGVNFVDVRSIFTGHSVCGSGGAWINGVSKASGSSGSVLPVVGSFHPNSLGQSYGYAKAFESYIDSATSRTPQGFPKNPADPPGPPVTTAMATDSVQSLITAPITTSTSACEGTYQAGQEVSISGSGFIPGGSVKIYVTSPSLDASNEQEVGEYKADPSGNIAETIRIPLTAIGFASSGASNNLVFVDAIGLGPENVHVDDTAMVGLMPHSSSCGVVEHLPFKGFYPPVANLPKINNVKHTRHITVRFSIPGMGKAPISDVLASGYPQSASVSCTDPGTITTGDPTVSAGGNKWNSFGDSYNYNWKTDLSWRGCRELVVKLVDGSYHRAMFDFGGHNHKWHRLYSWRQYIKK